MESDIDIVKEPVENPEERFLDFKARFRTTGAGLRLYAKCPALEAFILGEMEKHYGPALQGGLAPCKSIKGGYMYLWPGRVNVVPNWNGPPLAFREKDPLWSGDGSYLNLWWIFVQGLKDGISWTMRFPPDAEHMEGYVTHVRNFAREFGERISRPYEITLTLSTKVLK